MSVFKPVRPSLKSLLLLFCLIISASYNWADDKNLTRDNSAELIIQSINKSVEEADFSNKGADSCLKCHRQNSNRDATAIFTTLHGRNKMALQPLQCESCHGPGKNHTKSRLRKGDSRAPVITYGPSSPVPVEQQNHMCLSCHKDDKGKRWAGSGHERADVACASCHLIHQREDLILKKETQTEICQGCHQQVANEMQLRSAHPIKYGQMECADCHDTHDSLADASLVKNTLNESCFSCHADKRGPYLWEHAPVAEDCSLCHSSHGSINNALLMTRTPQLCQQCHSEAQHPSFGYQGTGVARRSGFVAGKSCMNCHHQVHGSNHPSGNLLQR